MDKQILITAEKTETIDSENSVVGWGSKPIPDRQKELIESTAWDLENFQKNPILCLAHDHKAPPIGRVMWVKNYPNGLKFKARFANTERGKEVYQLYKEGIMNAFSVGFKPKQGGYVDHPTEEKYKGLSRVYKAIELLEISCVSIPALPDALVEHIKSGKVVCKALQDELEPIILELEDFNGKGGEEPPEEEDQEVIFKGAIPYKDLGKADEGMAWKAGAEVKAASTGDLMQMCAWYDSSKKKEELVKGDFKLPHHEQANKNAVWRGVAAAMGALMGARGGVDIPDGDKKGVYNHLSKHYGEFDKEAPEYKEYLVDELKTLFPVEEEEQVGEPTVKDLMGMIANLEQRLDKQSKTVDGETSLPSVSDISSALDRVLSSMSNNDQPQLVNNPSIYRYVVDIYPTAYPDGAVIYTVYSYAGGQSTKNQYYRVSYVYDRATSTAKFADDQKLVEQTWMAKQYGEDVLAKMEDDFEEKAGRVLSQKNRDMMQKCMDEMGKCTEMMDGCKGMMQNMMDMADGKEYEEEEEEFEFEGKGGDEEEGEESEDDDLELEGDGEKSADEEELEIDGDIESITKGIEVKPVDVSSIVKEVVKNATLKAIGRVSDGK